MAELANDTAPSSPGAASAVQGARSAAQRFASALARRSSRGRPGDVISSARAPPIRRASLIQTAQSTSCSPSTRQNSLTLWLTTVAPMASA